MKTKEQICNDSSCDTVCYETDKLLLHADSMLWSQIYYTFELMCYYLCTTFTLGGDPSNENVLNEKLINKTHITAAT
jgi:hypothetical protein